MEISDYLVTDTELKISFLSVFLGPISMARAIKDYEPTEDNHIHFKEGDVVLVFSKNFGSDNSIWEGSVVRSICKLYCWWCFTL